MIDHLRGSNLHGLAAALHPLALAAACVLLAIGVCLTIAWKLVTVDKYRVLQIIHVALNVRKGRQQMDEQKETERVTASAQQ